MRLIPKPRSSILEPADEKKQDMATSAPGQTQHQAQYHRPCCLQGPEGSSSYPLGSPELYWGC